MKIIKTQVVFDKISKKSRGNLDHAINDIQSSIKAVVWPIGSQKFTIFPGKHANGVKPIKKESMNYLDKNGWVLEKRMSLVDGMRPGPIDAVKEFADGKFFAMEWETGNISSSHRALNKMALAIFRKQLMGGVLVLPSQALYPYLTDRIGNIKEIEPYIPLFQTLPIEEGFLSIIVIEHDEESDQVSKIPKGTDGRALK